MKLICGTGLQLPIINCYPMTSGDIGIADLHPELKRLKTALADVVYRTISAF